MSLRTAIKNDYKLVVLVLAAFLVMSLASYLFVSRVVKRQIDLHAQAEMRVYRNSLTSLNRACEDALLHAAMVMSIALERGIGPEGHLDLVRRLTAAFQTQGNLREVFNSAFCYLDGNLVEADGLAPETEAAMGGRPWFGGPWGGAGAPGTAGPGTIFHSDPYVDGRTGRAMVSLSCPIVDGSGTTRGVMGMDFLLDPVVRRVEALKPGSGGVFALLADQSDRVLAYPDRAAIGRRLSEMGGFVSLVPDLPASADDLLLRRLGLGDQEYVAFFSRLDNGWLLGILSPVSFYYGEAFDTFPVILAIALVLAVTLAVVLMRLSRARARSDEANRLKTHSLARISHELRTPLNAIIGLSDLARRDPGGPAAAGYLDDIHRSGGTLLSLVNDILDFSKMESGKFDLDEHPYGVGRLLGDVLALVSVRLRDKPLLEFRSEIADDLPSVLLGDDRALRQVLLNLLVNAVKYTSRGFVRLSAGFGRLDDSAVELVFEVSDSGVGIREDDLGHLFGDFVRLDGRLNRQVEGTGLGLSIARSLCRMMGGDVTVQSVLGQGSRFTATCRQAVLDPRPLGGLPGRVPAGRPDQAIAFTAPGLRVLLVDDVRTNLTVAQGLLAPYGLEVATAMSGLEALGMAREATFDLLFVDQMMPGLDGVGTLKRLRALGGSYLRVPIVALTANAVSGARETLLDQGFDDYVSKPVEAAEMANILDKWVPPEARRPAPRPAAPPGPPGQGEDVVARRGIQEADFLEALAGEGFEPLVGLRRSGGSLAKYQEVLAAFLLDAEAFSGHLSRPGGPEAL
ncbi:MAG: response regulator, partial [Deltaproteobacteria bacterium]|nr:response regulator [Deltaproteobacteria bacterium]